MFFVFLFGGKIPIIGIARSYVTQFWVYWEPLILLFEGLDQSYPETVISFLTTFPPL